MKIEKLHFGAMQRQRFAITTARLTQIETRFLFFRIARK